jgi:hypothetical protein
MQGTYQRCAVEQLHRYLAEFDLRYSTRIALGTVSAPTAPLRASLESASPIERLAMGERRVACSGASV